MTPQGNVFSKANDLSLRQDLPTFPKEESGQLKPMSEERQSLRGSLYNGLLYIRCQSFRQTRLRHRVSNGQWSAAWGGCCNIKDSRPRVLQAEVRTSCSDIFAEFDGLNTLHGTIATSCITAASIRHWCTKRRLFKHSTRCPSVCLFCVVSLHSIGAHYCLFHAHALAFTISVDKLETLRLDCPCL